MSKRKRKIEKVIVEQHLTGLKWRFKGEGERWMSLTEYLLWCIATGKKP